MLLDVKKTPKKQNYNGYVEISEKLFLTILILFKMCVGLPLMKRFYNFIIGILRWTNGVVIFLSK